ncbi:MAG: hypothetical protein ABEN55_11725 [Bradymonadaceae bacterium]
MTALDERLGAVKFNPDQLDQKRQSAGGPDAGPAPDAGDDPGGH